MEAYYKARRKKLILYSKQIKKLMNAGSIEPLKELRKTYRALLMETPPRDKYMSEQAYLKELKKSVREVQDPFMILKFDLCYDLTVGVEEYDTQEKQLISLKKTQDMLLKQKQVREHQAREAKKQEQEKYQGLASSFLYLDRADQLKTYLELEKMADAMANPQRQVIAYEIEHKEREYRLTQLYDPWVEVKLKA